MSSVSAGFEPTPTSMLIQSSTMVLGVYSNELTIGHTIHTLELQMHAMNLEGVVHQNHTSVFIQLMYVQ